MSAFRIIMEIPQVSGFSNGNIKSPSGQPAKLHTFFQDLNGLIADGHRLTFCIVYTCDVAGFYGLAEHIFIFAAQLKSIGYDQITFLFHLFTAHSCQSSVLIGKTVNCNAAYCIEEKSCLGDSLI